jgi:hypothetical protein
VRVEPSKESGLLKKGGKLMYLKCGRIKVKAGAEEGLVIKDGNGRK